MEERPGSSSEFTINRRDTNSAGLVYRGDFDRHHLQASVRNDNISGYGNQATGGLAYDLDLDDRWRVGVAGNTSSEARRAGKECVSTCRSRWSPFHKKKKKTYNN